jgi:hypothetical protein
MILVAVLGMIMIATALMVGLVKLSELMNQSAQNYTSSVRSGIQSDALSDRVRLAMTRHIQLQMLETRTTGVNTPLNESDLMTTHGAVLEENERVISMRCIGQGPKPMGICDSSSVLPKIYELKVQTTDQRTGISSISQSEFQIQQANLSSYAFFIKNETAPTVTLGPAAFNGIFGINFAPPASGEDIPVQRVRFRPAESTISFQNVFMTNLENAQAAFDIPDASRVLFNQGVVDRAAAISFQALDDLHVSLKGNSINKGDVMLELEPKCSKVSLTSTQNILYQEFESATCDGEALFSKTYAPSDDQTLLARGQKVLLDSNTSDGKTKVNNVAIVADGDVELRSSIIRDSTDRGITDGYPMVMAKGNLVIPPQMRTLFNQTLGEMSEPADPSKPTIQVDLSYVSISSPENGSVQFDSSLWDATSETAARNLGTAILNGLFVSTTTPKTRRIFSNSDVIDGFREVEWTYPPALSAIDTQWFKTQVNGGALVSIVTRYEKKDLDQNQALDAYSGVGSIDSPTFSD